MFGWVFDQYGKLVLYILVEMWQVNVGGCYWYKNDCYLVLFDLNFGGVGWIFIDSEGYYYFCIIKFGFYFWCNGFNDWCLVYIYVFVSGLVIVVWLVIQMYFEGDLLIFKCLIICIFVDLEVVQSLIGWFDMSMVNLMDCLVYCFDIVLCGQCKIFFENV